MKYEFTARHEQKYSVKKMCELFGISRSGYYAWQKRPISQREKDNLKLLEEIRKIHQRSRGTYGSPRIFVYLRGLGLACGRHRVARLMKKHQIRGRKAYRNRPITTRQDPKARFAPNLLNRKFTATQPNQKWVSDITYIDTVQGWLYLATILDLYSRRVVGWAMSSEINTALVSTALHMATVTRHPTSDLLHHSDRGCQYTSADYQSQLEVLKCQVSMSRTGNCYDNAVMESFYATLKAECATKQFSSYREARSAIFEYIEGWYNRERLHSSLGYRSPLQFEIPPGH